jgi:hypothetical protein
MIAFQTLFLGLVFGLVPVRVMVGPTVAAVEFALDGVVVGTAHGEPWEAACRFGPNPLPHELVAIARDTNGNEIGRVRQWINLAKPAAQALAAVQPGVKGAPAVVRLSWKTIDDAAPKRFDVTLDGVPVKVKDPTGIELPPLDLARAHFLRAEVVFPKGVVARAETTVGGEIEAAAASELTAVAVVVRPGFTLPPVESMQGWFLQGGQPVRVVAVDEGYFDVAMVFDQDCFGRFRAISAGYAGTEIFDPNFRVFGRTRGSEPRAMGQSTTIQASSGGNRLFGLWAVPTTTQELGKQEVRGLFQMSFSLDLDIDEVRTLIFRFPRPTAPAKAQSLANAVATAGMYATALNRRRAVVLVVGEAPADLATIPVTAARAYLESLNVPLLIWTPERRISTMNLPGWGLPDDVSTDLQLQAAMSRLGAALAGQRIVWLAGSHLPNTITIAPNIRHVFLARGVIRQERSSAHP